MVRTGYGWLGLPQLMMLNDGSHDVFLGMHKDAHLKSFVPPPLLKAVAGECQWASGQKLCSNSGMANDWWHQPYGSQSGTDRSARFSAPAARLHQAKHRNWKSKEYHFGIPLEYLSVSNCAYLCLMLWMASQGLMLFPTKAFRGAGMHQGGAEFVGGQ